MFIGSKKEKLDLMKQVLPLYLNDETWLERVKPQYNEREYNNIREVIVEAIDKKYIVNLEAIRTIKDGIYLYRLHQDKKPLLTMKGEKFLKRV